MQHNVEWNFYLVRHCEKNEDQKDI